MSSTWEEVEVTRKENRRELVLTGKTVADRITKSGLDSAIFTLTNLNFLDISSASLPSVPDDLGNLVNLTNLVLKGNSLTRLPTSLNLLTKLKLLDVSMNSITDLPDMSGLVQLNTLNLAINSLEGDLPSCGLISCQRLAILDISLNGLTSLGELEANMMELLAEVQASKNKIATLSCDIAKNWPAVKKLDLSENALKSVPGELADCVKLKELSLIGNPLSDNRFKKMAAQKGTKSVLDYIRQNCPKGGADGGAQSGSKSKSGKKSKNKDSKAAIDESVDALCDILSVVTVNEKNPVIVVTEQVKDVRPYIVACIVRGVDLTGENLRKFIKSQTALHNTVCEKRSAATIATHDLDKVKGSELLYTALPPESFKIIPLNSEKAVRANKLVARLQKEADEARKDKKRSQISGLHQYLHMLDRASVYPCFKDGDDVISFPPVTNSGITKITEETKNVLIEVTSNTKLATAKLVCDAVLKEMLELGLGGGEEGKRSLMVEQVKVLDEEGSLKVVYPSKTDLIFDTKNICVERP